MPEGATVLGRDPSGDVFIDHPSISRRHAQITVSPEGVTIEDLGSKNGTSVGGERTEGLRELADADEIRLGLVPLTIRLYPSSKSTKTA